MFQVGCAVPLGPGFGHVRRQVAVRADMAEAAQVHVRIADELVNAGNRELPYLDVDSPAGRAVDRGRLTILVDGRELQVSSLNSEPSAPQRIRFVLPWVPKQRQTLFLDYDLPAGSSDGGIIGATAEGFYIADRFAFPVYLPPVGIFVRSDSQARAQSIEVTAPAEFRVLASGRERRTIRSGETTVRQFRLSPADFPVYVIAGRYLEQNVKTSHGSVIFWTFRPLDAPAAQAAAARLAATAVTFGQVFGPLAKNSWPVRIVELPTPTAPSRATGSEIAAGSFPQGVLLDGRSITQGIASEPVLERAEYELAGSWFGWRTRPSLESKILLGSGIGLFAVARAAEARGGEAARRKQVEQLLARYDAARQEAADGALLKLSAGLSREQEATNSYRAALFLLALEDLAGREGFDRVLRRIWMAMAGKEIAVAELRSAIEAETGRDLGAVFRAWLNGPGLPGDFRARYAASPERRASISETVAGQSEAR